MPSPTIAVRVRRDEPTFLGLLGCGCRRHAHPSRAAVGDALGTERVQIRVAPANAADVGDAAVDVRQLAPCQRDRRSCCPAGDARAHRELALPDRPVLRVPAGRVNWDGGPRWRAQAKNAGHHGAERRSAPSHGTVLLPAPLPRSARWLESRPCRWSVKRHEPPRCQASPEPLAMGRSAARPRAALLPASVCRSPRSRARRRTPWTSGLSPSTSTVSATRSQ